MDRGAVRNRGSVGALASAAARPSRDAGPQPSAHSVAPAGTDAVAVLYREHHPFVWRSLARLGVLDDRLPDATHDVFMVVARRLGEFEGRSSIRTWLFAICIRKAQSIRRDSARERRHLERYGSIQRETSVRPHDRADAATTLRALLQQLDEDKRVVFIMAELERMTAPEIASALSIKPATVYSRLRLARAGLDRAIARQRARERREADGPR